MSSFLHAQQSNNLNNFELTLGNETKHCNLKGQLVAIVGDMQGGDKITGKKVSLKEGFSFFPYKIDSYILLMNYE